MCLKLDLKIKIAAFIPERLLRGSIHHDVQILFLLLLGGDMFVMKIKSSVGRRAAYLLVRFATSIRVTKGSHFASPSLQLPQAPLTFA